MHALVMFLEDWNREGSRHLTKEKNEVYDRVVIDRPPWCDAVGVSLIFCRPRERYFSEEVKEITLL